MYLWNIMLTSLLADKLVKLEIKLLWYLMNKIINPPCNSWKPRRSSYLMKKSRKVELFWEARVVVMWTVPEQLRMLECPLLFSSPLIPPLYESCCQSRSEQASTSRGHRGWPRVRDHLSGWTSVDCRWMRLRGSHVWGSSWEGWSHFRDRDCVGCGWTTDLLAFKLLNNQYFY